jgi:tRNA U34 2-thiouridine synthase MnmA/TrmU
MLVQFRYQQQPQPCVVYILDSKRIRIVFDAPAFAVSLGQIAALYIDQICVGGGTIDAYSQSLHTDPHAQDHGRIQQSISDT